MATAQNTSSTSLAGNSSNDSSDSVHNIGNPFYLHPNEKPSSILVSPVIQSLKQGDLSVTDYKNEAEVGDALAEAFKTGLVKTEDLSITTKLWNTVVIPKILENDTASVYGPEEDEDALYACMGWPPTNIAFWGGVLFFFTAIGANIFPVFNHSVQDVLTPVAIVLILCCSFCYVHVYRRLTANPHIDGEHNDDQEPHNGNGGNGG